MRRLRLRFSLRSLFIVFTAFAVVVGYYVSRAQQQRRAVAAIERLGGTVFYDYAYDHHEDPGESSLNPFVKPPNTWLVNALGRDFFHSVVGVYGYQEQHYRSYGSLLTTFGPSRIDTEFSKNTDEALRHLRGIRSLIFLDLSKTTVTDAGLAELDSLKSLERLRLVSTGITDDGLASLVRIRGLSSVSLWQTKVTEDGIRKLRSAAPNLIVWHLRK